MFDLFGLANFLKTQFFIKNTHCEDCCNFISLYITCTNSGDMSLEYEGCHVDVSDASQSDSLHQAVNNENWVTPTACVGRCRKLGYLFAGVQDQSFCFCGNSFGSRFSSNLSFAEFIDSSVKTKKQ